MPSLIRTAGATEARSILGVLGGVGLWAALYSQLEPFSRWLVAALSVPEGTRLHEAVAFFAYDTPKVLLLLVLVVFGMGVVPARWPAAGTSPAPWARSPGRRSSPSASRGSGA